MMDETQINPRIRNLFSKVDICRNEPKHNSKPALHMFSLVIYNK